MASNEGFIKLMRTEEVVQMVSEDPMAFSLLTIIAWRAKRTSDYNRHNLQVGECLLGDYENYGMSRSQYRSACGRLVDRLLISKKKTNKGLVVKLLDSRIYDINIEDNRHPIASQSPANRQPIATIKNERMKEGKEVYKKKTFQKPTIEELKLYVAEAGYTINCQAFLDFYDSKGWVIGKSQSPMKDWKAAVRTWVRMDSTKTGQQAGKIRLLPLPGKTCCKCGMPAIHKTSGNFDNYYCQEHMPQKIKEKYYG